jgi:Mg2+ and Co2+ transporter CorA
VVAEDSPTADLGEATLVGEKPEAEAPPSHRSAPTTCVVVHDRGSAQMDFSRERVVELLASGGFFWLDLDEPDKDDFSILREVFGFHPLAVEDSEHFDQRAKIDDYDDFVFLVVYGASCPRHLLRREETRGRRSSGTSAARNLRSCPDASADRAPDDRRHGALAVDRTRRSRTSRGRADRPRVP